jgi:putative serine protease PepD
LRAAITLVVLLVLVSCGDDSTPPPTVTPTLTTTPTAVPPTPTHTATPTAVPPTPTPTPPPLTFATVQIFAKIREEDTLETGWTGSGTIISPDGLILTNAHVAAPYTPWVAALYGDSELLDAKPDALVVALVKREDRPPVETYIAEVVAVDGPLDLAVIKIVETTDGNPVNPADLDLAFVELGDSDELRIDHEIRICGFPRAGRETITCSRGVVSGFESQDRVGERAWMKTDTDIGPGSSGGLAANEQGQIIGVPTFSIDSFGGAINRMRAINPATDLIEHAQDGLDHESPYIVCGSGKEDLTFEAWAEDIDDDGCAVNPVTEYPFGVSEIFGVFSYRDMRDGEAFYERWYIDDELVDFFRYTWLWGGGASSNCYPAFPVNYGNVLPAGTYRVVLACGSNLEWVEIAEEEVEIVLGPEPLPDVWIYGYITDADTGNGIPGAILIILNPGTDLVAWVDAPNEDDVYTSAETDSNGFYELPDPLMRGVMYPALAAHQEYFIADGVLFFGPDEESPFQLDIQLTK